MLNRELLPLSDGLERIVFVTPAAPGFYVLTPCYDEDGGAIYEASREPVIAWALDSLGCSYPIALNDGLCQTGDPAILCPDGQVRSYDRGWEALDDWLKEQREVLEAKGA